MELRDARTTSRERPLRFGRTRAGHRSAIVTGTQTRERYQKGTAVRNSDSYIRRLAGNLLLTAFAEFHRRGLHRVGLGVDTGKHTGALRLYGSVGMRTAHQHGMWRRTVPAAEYN